MSNEVVAGPDREARGLSSNEAAERLSSVGPNALPERPPDPLWRRFVRQFASPLIYILLFALAFDLGLWLYEGAHGWPIEATCHRPDPSVQRGTGAVSGTTFGGRARVA